MSHKVLYNTPLDRRYDIHSISGPEAPKIQKLAEAVACIVLEKNIHYNSKANHYQLSPTCPTLEEWLKDIYGAADVSGQVRFSKEKQVGDGTAFLVGKRVVLTAAHCVCQKTVYGYQDALDSDKIKVSYLVFGFFASHPGEKKETFPKRDVYQISKVVQYQYSRSNLRWADWALLLLDRDVEGRDPFSLDFSSLALGTGLYMLGHPTGISQKYTYGATIKKKQAREEAFKSDLDAFGGNSGSPVIREDTHAVVGILCEGGDDYTVRNLGGRLVVDSNFRDPTLGEFETCQAMTTLAPIQDYLDYGLLQIAAPPSPSPGLYLEVQCERKGCTRFGNVRWITLGIQSKFNIREVASKATCDSDGLMSLKTLRVGMWQCHFEIDGLIKQPKMKWVMKQGKADGPSLWVISDDFDEKWEYLHIKTRVL